MWLKTKKERNWVQGFAGNLYVYVTNDEKMTEIEKIESALKNSIVNDVVQNIEKGESA